MKRLALVMVLTLVAFVPAWGVPTTTTETTQQPVVFSDLEVPCSSTGSVTLMGTVRIMKSIMTDKRGTTVRVMIDLHDVVGVDPDLEDETPQRDLYRIDGQAGTIVVNATFTTSPPESLGLALHLVSFTNPSGITFYVSRGIIIPLFEEGIEIEFSNPGCP